jgi:hypothetical protein
MVPSSSKPMAASGNADLAGRPVAASTGTSWLDTSFWVAAITAHIIGAHADVAQLAEQLFCKQRVAGSNPAVGSRFEYETGPFGGSRARLDGPYRPTGANYPTERPGISSGWLSRIDGCKSCIFQLKGLTS